ncbi:MAG: hypothetical protein Q4C30_00200 [Bacteroidia bacterium]|nr:hypothetical protein [Bacteroidia bacterium]
MIQHYIKIAIRNLKKYKMQTTISVVSMAVGITVLAIVHSLMQAIDYRGSIEDNPEYYKVHYANGQICMNPIFLQKLQNREFKSIDRFYPIPAAYYSSPVYLGVDSISDKNEFVTSRIAPIYQELVDFLHLKSAVTNGPLTPLNDNSVYVTEGFALTNFGTVNVIGKRLETFLYDYTWNDGNTNYDLIQQEKSEFVIADVIHVNYRTDMDGEIYNKYDKPYFPTHKIYIIPSEGCEYQQLCDDLVPFADAMPGLYQGIIIGYEPWRLHDPDIDESTVVKSFSYSIALLILIAALLGYIRMQIQLFWMRQREIALRTVVGGGRNSLLKLFFTEVGIVLSLTIIVSLFFCHILRKELYEVLFTHLVKNDIVWEMNDFIINAVAITCFTAVICMVMVIGTVYQIRRNQTGLALQMKPNTSHLMRKVAIGFQMVLSTIFIALSLMIYESALVANDENISTQTLSNSFHLILLDDTTEKVDEKVNQIKQLDIVEEVTPWKMNYKIYNEDEKPEFFERDFFCYVYQENNELVNYLKIDITPVECSVDKDHTIYVSEKLYDKMTKGGTQPAASIDIEGEPRYVAGTFPNNIFLNRGFECLILNGKTPYFYNSYLVLPKEGCSGELRKKLTDIRNEGLESVPKGYESTYGEEQGQGKEVQNSMIRIVYILTLVNIISTCSSLYSAVSLDVRRRRKEVSLRKINGAVASDIFKLFAKDYIVLLIVCFVMALPLCYLASMLTNGGLGYDDVYTFATTLLVRYLQVIAIITIVTAIAVGGKIWSIMHLKPVEGVSAL